MLQPRQIPLSTHRDERGALTEIFRKDWLDVPTPVQWNFVQSEANVLRGVHVHVTHIDCLVPLHGRMLVGLNDLRGDAAGRNQGELVELSADDPSLLMIPPGVAHGFYFAGPASFVYGVSHVWDPVNDEFGCHWSDPALGIPWPAECVSPWLSARDEKAGSLDLLLTTLRSRGHNSW
jgi:dTDP-4-dehydrorhamnose 3,5-epimerase